MSTGRHHPCPDRGCAGRGLPLLGNGLVCRRFDEARSWTLYELHISTHLSASRTSRVHLSLAYRSGGPMFSTSLRRVARNCSNGAPIPSRPSTPTIASFTSNSHQRRHSSSKPPIPPNNGSPPIPASSVKQVGAPRTDPKRPGAESRVSKKRNSKDKVDTKQDVQDNWTSNLPAVPSLQHLNPKGIIIKIRSQ